MNASSLSIIAVLVAPVVSIQATSVALWNSPSGNALKVAAQPFLRHYAGPWVAQNWSLFAPDPASFNSDVLVQARSSSGARTSWYDVSRYFDLRARSNPLFAEHYESEALAHAADFAFSPSPYFRAQSRIVMRHIALAVLKRYIHHPIVALRIEIDRRYIPVIPPSRPRSHSSADKRFPWISVQDVGSSSAQARR